MMLLKCYMQLRHKAKDWYIMVNFRSLTALIHNKSRMNVAQILKGLSYKVSPEFLSLG